MKHRHLTTGVLALAAAVAMGTAAESANAAANYYWVKNATGNWTSAANWTNGPANTIPGVGDSAWFTWGGTAHATIGAGENVSVAQVRSRQGTTVTITLENTATLATSDNIYVDGDNATTSYMTIEGPAAGQGTATATVRRLWLTAGSGNSTKQSGLTLTGPGLTVNTSSPTNNYSQIGGGAALIVTNGATVNTQFGATSDLSTLYLHSGTVPTGFPNLLSIDNGGTAKTGTIYFYDGLIQLASTGTLNLSTGARVLVDYADSASPTTGDARMEAAGTGLQGGVQVRSGGTLAIGLTDRVTHTRTAAETLTLNNNVELDSGGHLEFGIFAAGGSDQTAAAGLAGTSNDLLNLNHNLLTSSGALLEVKTFGYTPQAGQVFQLISGNLSTPYAFNTSDLAGKWTVQQNSNGLFITAVPEPASLMLLGLGGLLMLRRRKAS